MLIVTVVSDFAVAMAGTILVVYPTVTRILDRFHLVQFFADAQQHRRCYLGEAKKQHKSRFIDHRLARKPEGITEERGFVWSGYGRLSIQNISIPELFTYLSS